MLNARRVVAIGMCGVASSLFVGCASTEYYGESYPITTHVDVYWDDADVHRAYSVIGRAVTMEGFGDSDDMIKSIREEAMQRGAHGVIITELDSIEQGSSESGSDKDDFRFTTIDREERIESKFIRYH